MPRRQTLRRILPANKDSNSPVPNMGSSDKRRHRTSMACRKCKEKRTKCSGTKPCTSCAAKACDCIYEPSRDRRRKSYVAELSNFQSALHRLINRIRGGTTDEVLQLAWEIQSLPTDQDAINCLVQLRDEQ